MALTNRLQTAQNFDVNKIGTISGAIKSPVKSIQELAWNSNPVVSSQPIAKPSLNPQIQQSQAGSTMPNPTSPTVIPWEQLFTPMPSTIPATGWGNNMFQQPLSSDVFLWLQYDINNKDLTIEEMAELYPEIPEDVRGGLYYDIKYKWLAKEELPELYPEFDASGFKGQYQPEAGIRAWAARMGNIPFIGEKANDVLDTLRVPWLIWEELDDLVVSISDWLRQKSADVLWLSISKREQDLENRLRSLDQRSIEQWKEKFYNLSTELQNYYWSPENFIREWQKSYLDKMLWVADDDLNVARMLWSIAFGLPKFLSWIARAALNPVDTMIWTAKWLYQTGYEAVQTVKELRSWDKTFGEVWEDAKDYIQKRLEYDPWGLASDVIFALEKWWLWAKSMRWVASWAEMVWAKSLWTNLRSTATAFESMPKWMRDTSWWWLDFAINKLLSSENAQKMNTKMMESWKEWWAKNVAKAWLYWATKFLIEEANPLQTTAKYAGKLVDRAAWVLIPDNRLKEAVKTDVYINSLVDDVQRVADEQGDLFSFKDYTNNKISEFVWQSTKRLDELEKKERELSPAYDDIKKMWVPLDVTNLQNSVLDNILDPENWVFLKDWKLEFSTTSKVSQWERTSLQKAFDIINDKPVQTYGDLINARQAMKMDWAVDFKGWSTPMTMKVYNALDAYMKENIPFFDEVTSMYRDKIEWINALKEDLLDKDWAVKSSAYGKLLNINSPAQIEFKARLMEVAPQLVAQAESLALLKQVEWLRNNSKWLGWAGQIFSMALAYSGYKFFGDYLWGIAWYAAAWFLNDIPMNFLQNIRYDHIVKIMKSVSQENREFLWEIGVKISQKEKLTKLEEAKATNILKQINRQAELLWKMDAYKGLSVSPSMIINK